MSQAASSAESGLLGAVTFGPRDSGLDWKLLALLAVAVLIGLWIWSEKGK